MLSTFKFYLRDLHKNPLLHLLTIFTISITVFLISLVLLLQSNMIGWVRSARPTPLAFIYLKDGLDFASVSRLKEKVLSLQKVKNVTWKNRNQVWTDVQGTSEVTGELQNELTQMLPDLLEVEFSEITPGALESFKMGTQGLAEIEELDLPEDWNQRFIKFETIVFGLGWGLAALLFLGFVFLGSNVIFMRNHTRFQQIEFIHLLGASRWYLISPLLLEALVEGIVGTSLAMAALVGSLECVRTLMGSKLTFLGIQIATLPSPSQVFFYFMLGVTATVVTGTIASKRMLPSPK